MAVGTLESIPILKPGVVLAHMQDTLSETEKKLLNNLDGKTVLSELAVEVGLPKELARQTAQKLVERQLLLLLVPEGMDEEDKESRVDLPGMRYLDDLDTVSLKGSTKRHEIAKLLVKIHLDGLTGILRVNRPKLLDEDEAYYKNIYFLKGNIIDCRTHPFQASECLGRVLQRAGRLSDKEVVNSLRNVKSEGILQGAALVKSGFIKPDFLQVALQNQLELKIGEIFEWESCYHEFASRDGFSTKIARIDCSLAYLLFNALWKHYPINEVEKQIEVFAKKYLGKTKDPPFSVAALQFDKVLGKFWTDVLDRDMMFKRLLIISSLNKAQTYQTLLGLYSLGMIEILHESRQDPLEEMSNRLYEMIKSLERQSYFDVLSIHWSANGEMIEEAYRRKRQDVLDEMKGHTDVIKMLFEQVLKLVEKAYQGISTVALRKSYRVKIYDSVFLEFNSDIFRQKGESYLFTKDEHDKAIDELESAIEVYDKEGEYYTLLGLALFYRYYPKDQEQVMRARELIAQGIRMHPESEVVHLCEGLMYKHENRLQNAAKSLKKAFKMNPKNNFARVELESLTGKVSEAERQKAIREFLNRKEKEDKGWMLS